MRMLRGFKGSLSREDMEILHDAGKRKLKYPKVFTRQLRCTACDYTWFYQAAKCPACESTDVKR